MYGFSRIQELSNSWSFLAEDLMNQGKWLLFYWQIPKTKVLASNETFMNQLDSKLVWWYCWTLYFGTSLSDLDLYSRSPDAGKWELRQWSHKRLDWCGWNLLCKLRLVVSWIKYSFYHIQSICEGENPSYVIFFQKQIKVSLHVDSYRFISFKLGMMVGITKLYILLWLDRLQYAAVCIVPGIFVVSFCCFI